MNAYDRSELDRRYRNVLLKRGNTDESADLLDLARLSVEPLEVGVFSVEAAASAGGGAAAAAASAAAAVTGQGVDSVAAIAVVVAAWAADAVPAAVSSVPEYDRPERSVLEE